MTPKTQFTKGENNKLNQKKIKAFVLLKEKKNKTTHTKIGCVRIFANHTSHKRPYIKYVTSLPNSTGKAGDSILKCVKDRKINFTDDLEMVVGTDTGLVRH